MEFNTAPMLYPGATRFHSAPQGPEIKGERMDEDLAPMFPPKPTQGGFGVIQHHIPQPVNAAYPTSTGDNLMYRDAPTFNAAQQHHLLQHHHWQQHKPIIDLTNHERGSAFFVEAQRQLDPRVANPTGRLHGRTALNPESQAMAGWVAHNRPPHMQPHGLLHSRTQEQPHSEVNSMSQMAAQSYSIPQSSSQFWTSPSLHAMPQSQPTPQPQHLSRSAWQPAAQPVAKLSQNRILKINKELQLTLNIPSGSSGQGTGNNAEQAILQQHHQGQPDHSDSSEPVPEYSEMASLPLPLPCGTSSGDVLRVSTGLPLVAAKDPTPQPVVTNPEPIQENDQGLPSMHKDEPVDFTWMLNHAEAELGRTGKYDKRGPVRQKSLAVLAAGQVGRILKKLDGKMVNHGSFSNRVHILTVMREIIHAFMNAPTRPAAGAEAPRYLAYYQSLFLAAVDKLTQHQKNRLKVLEGGLWMLELQDMVELAEGTGVSAGLEQALARIDCWE
ncbi:hypothetical protein PG987_003391 [Apiospora arundinis]